MFSPACLPPCTLAVNTSEPLQSLPLCLKQEMSPEVTSTSPSPNLAAASNLAFVELQALQKPVSVSNSCSSSSNHFPNAFNSFSHHAPVYGQFSSQPIISGNAGIHLIHVHTHLTMCAFIFVTPSLSINLTYYSSFCWWIIWSSYYQKTEKFDSFSYLILSDCTK